MTTEMEPDFTEEFDNFIITTTPHINLTNATGIEELIREAKEDVVGFWIGVGLSVISSFFIGGSFIVKKKALIRLSRGGLRANQGGYGYLKSVLWWAGLLSMGVGEAANFIAYAFAPASLVSVLGVLSVLMTTILSSKYLKERLNFIGKLGCLLCTLGSTVIVIHAPMEKEIEDMAELQDKILNPIFIVYVNAAIALSVILIYHFRPKLPETSTYTLLIWIGVCSLIGSLSVMSIKGFGLALTLTLGGTSNEMGNWITWFCVAALIITVCIQMNFLNKALDTFNTAVVTPVYYVMFTTCVIVASAILFREFDSVSLKDWVGLICGFMVVLTAIILLHFCKNFDVSLAQLAQQINFTSEKDDERGVDLDNPTPTTYRDARTLSDQRIPSDVNFRLLCSDNPKDLVSYGTGHMTPGRI
ncbi:magnesium transporter NIPA2 [Folsomia candida]|uniref:magnesium transporter NIPA2 n=1 Tax=Folsomia candida TaxID=158441 RepID=UPI000B902B1D|nr:magnesium transporter NIPA2 [Folsomia candida]